MTIGFIATAFAVLFESLVISVFTHQILEPRLNRKISVVLYAILISVVFLAIVPLEKDYVGLKSFIWFTFYILCPFVLFKGRILKIAFVQAFFIIAMLGSEIFFSVILMSMQNFEVTIVQGYSIMRAYITVGVTFPLTVLLTVALYFWNKRKNVIKTHSMLLFALFPLSQAVFLFAILVMKYGVLNIKTSMGISLVGGFISIAADVLMVRAMMENSRKYELEAYIKNMEYQNKAQLVYYESLQQHNEELAKIRHDYKNHIAVVKSLIEKGGSADVNDGKDILMALQNEIATTEIGNYTQNNIVNAVLCDKVSDCKSKGINIDIDVFVPNEINIEKLHICSAFSNLLDNAIKAVNVPQVTDKNIVVRAQCELQYLFIKVENKFVPAIKTQRSGYGLEIVRDIANRYNGELIIQKNDGVFTAILSLKI